MFKLTSWWRPKDVRLQVLLWDVFRTFLGRFSLTDLLVSNTHIWWTKTENITTEMRFVLMLKTDVLGRSRERYPLNVILEPL